MAQDISDAALAIAARQILVSKLALEKELPFGYISDPAVGILLSLFIHFADGLTVTETELSAILYRVPTKTLKRWILAIESDGHLDIRREKEEEEIIALTNAGIALVRRTLTAAASAERRVRFDPSRMNTSRA